MPTAARRKAAAWGLQTQRLEPLSTNSTNTICGRLWNQTPPMAGGSGTLPVALVREEGRWSGPGTSTRLLRVRCTRPPGRPCRRPERGYDPRRLHGPGRDRAWLLLDNARAVVAGVPPGARPDEVTFTSGTDAVHRGSLSCAGPGLWVGPTRPSSTLRPPRRPGGADAAGTVVPPSTGEGRVDPPGRVPPAWSPSRRPTTRSAPSSRSRPWPRQRAAYRSSSTHAPPWAPAAHWLGRACGRPTSGAGPLAGVVVRRASLDNLFPRRPADERALRERARRRWRPRHALRAVVAERGGGRPRQRALVGPDPGRRSRPDVEVVGDPDDRPHLVTSCLTSTARRS